MIKYLKISGWIFIGILLQMKFDVLYQIVCLENLAFHPRAYSIKMNIVHSEENLRVLHIETAVRYALGKEYFAYIYIPTQYKVINKSPQLGVETIPGYQVYAMDMKQKYRDVQATMDFMIAPKKTDDEIASVPIQVHFENIHQRLYDDKSYAISTAGKDTQLKGPPKIEVKYPQQWGF